MSVSRAAKLAGIDRGTWTGVEEATRATESYNYSRIERVIEWQPGSIDAILEGGMPTAMDVPTRTPPTLEDLPASAAGADLPELISLIQQQPWDADDKLELIQQASTAARRAQEQQRREAAE